MYTSLLVKCLVTGTANVRTLVDVPSRYSKGKGEAIPFQALTGPEGSRK
jgi:hypothetical protein